MNTMQTVIGGWNGLLSKYEIYENLFSNYSSYLTPPPGSQLGEY